MSRTNIPEKIKILLWAKTGGRCQYRGCNKDLTEDLASGTRDAKSGFIAHIVADEPGGPRGDPVRSVALAKEICNLMLMCGTHHRLIDDEKPDEHPEALLLEMKQAHETRIREVAEDRASHALCYDAVIGGHESPVAFDRVRRDMLPNRYPAEGRAIQIGTHGASSRDSDADYWNTQRLLLQREFAWKVRERIARREIDHLSVFALAPQPLLMELGRLLCNIVPAEVHQLHRDPKGWRWANDVPPVSYEIGRPLGISGPPALVWR